MRNYKDKYCRDLKSIEIAQRMLAREARTQTICAWTGLKRDRVQNLVYTSARRSNSRRHRGPSPRRLSTLLCTIRMQDEAAAAAGLCRVLQVLPERAIPSARKDLPNPLRAERLLKAFELFREAVPQARLTLEQLVLVVLTLAEGNSWVIDNCTRCHATILIDKLGVAPRRLCTHCGSTETLAMEDRELGDMLPARRHEEAFVQQRLFD
jgi:hypothetical protein